MPTELPPGSADTSDAAEVHTRADLAAALTALRNRAGLSVREVVTRSNGLHGTISGWFAGQHVPTRASTPMFDAVLAACGVTDPDARAAWHDAAGRARRNRSPRPTSRPASPYRGLEPYGADDTDRYFGRDEVTAALLTRVEAAASGSGPRVLTVIGASGAGKSSLLRAGLIPRVGCAGTALAEWHTVIVSPGPDPIETLAAALDESDDGPTVLIVDQLEELWTHLPDPDERERFLMQVTAPEPDRVVVLALRADYYGPAAAEWTLLPTLDAGPLVIGPLTPDQLRDVIVLPARTRGVTVDDDLVRLLLDTLTSGSATGALPLLSHTLDTMWSRLAGNRLTVADYFATGGIDGAVQQSAEDVYGGLSPARQAIAKQVFLRLVSVDGDTVTRRRARRAELFGDDENVTAVVDAFADRRLLTLGDDTVEVSHEALLRTWSRVLDWIADNREALVVQRRIGQALQLWEDSGRDNDALLSGGRLALAQEWAAEPEHALSEPEHEFLAASGAREAREHAAENERVRTLRRLVRRLTVVSVVAALLAIAALVAGATAKSHQDGAERARNEARSRQVATEAVRMRDKDPALSAQLALAAARIDPTLEARSALLDATATHTATRILGPAGGMKARVSPDGDWIAAAASDGIVRIWDTDTVGAAPSATAELVSSPEGRPLFALAISDDGRLLVSGGAGQLVLWDVSEHTRPERLADLELPAEEAANDIALTSDASTLAVVSSGGSVLRWDIRNPAAPVALPDLAPPAGETHVSAAFGPGDRLLAVGGTAESVQIWDATRPDAPAPLFANAPVPASTNTVFSVAFSPDGRVLAGGTAGRVIVRWSIGDPARPTPLPPLTGFTSYVNEVTFSPDGTLLAGGSSDNSVRIWRTADDVPLTTLPGPAVVTSAQFTSSGDALVTAGVDGTTRMWPMPGPVLTGATDSVFTTPVADDLLLVGAGSRGGGYHLWDITDPEHSRSLPTLKPQPGDRFSGASGLSAARRLAAGGTADGKVYLWDVSDPEHPRLLGDPVHAVDDIIGVVAFAPDGRTLLASGQSSKEFRLFDLTDPASPQPLSTLEATNYPQAVSFTPDGHLLAVSTTDNTIELWDLTDLAAPSRSTTLTGFDSYAQAVTFSPDGSILAGGSADRSVRLWDMTNPDQPQPAATIEELSGAVYSLGFSPAGDRLAASLGSGEIGVWSVDDADTVEADSLLRAYPNRVFDAQFSSGGGRLVAAGPDKVVRIWSTDSDQAADQICRTAGTAITEPEWRRYVPGVPYSPPCPR